MSAHPYQHIDPGVLLRAVDHDVEAYRSLCLTFLRITPRMLSKLEKALAADDRSVIVQTSHSLRGSSTLVGAHGLSALLQEIEQRAKHTGPLQAWAPIAEVQTLTKAVMQEVGESAAAMRTQGPPESLI